MGGPGPGGGFGDWALVQRCQVHKQRNVLEHLPERQRIWVRAAPGAGRSRRAFARRTSCGALCRQDRVSGSGSRIRALSIEEIEAEALKLDPKARARLAGKLLESLEQLSDEENAGLWAEEAERRDQEWDAKSGVGRPARELNEAIQYYELERQGSSQHSCARWSGAYGSSPSIRRLGGLSLWARFVASSSVAFLTVSSIPSRPTALEFWRS